MRAARTGKIGSYKLLKAERRSLRLARRAAKVQRQRVVMKEYKERAVNVSQKAGATGISLRRASRRSCDKGKSRDLQAQVLCDREITVQLVRRSVVIEEWEWEMEWVGRWRLGRATAAAEGKP